LAIFPAPSTSSALRYSKTAAKYTEAFLLTLTPVIVYFNFRLSLPAGNMIPALDDADLDLLIEAFANFPDFPRLLADMDGLASTFGLMLLLELVATSDEDAAGIVAAGLDILLDLLAGATAIGGGGAIIGAGKGALLSNSASGTLETDNAIDEAL